MFLYTFICLRFVTGTILFLCALVLFVFGSSLVFLTIFFLMFSVEYGMRICMSNHTSAYTYILNCLVQYIQNIQYNHYKYDLHKPVIWVKKLIKNIENWNIFFINFSESNEIRFITGIFLSLFRLVQINFGNFSAKLVCFLPIFFFWYFSIQYIVYTYTYIFIHIQIYIITYEQT